MCDLLKEAEMAQGGMVDIYHQLYPQTTDDACTGSGNLSDASAKNVSWRFAH